MTRGSSTLVPQGTVEVFDRHEQLAALDDDAAGPAAGGRRLPRQRPHRRVRARPAGAAARLAGRRAAGPRGARADALAAAGHLPPDRDGRDERDAEGAGRVRLLRPRLPRRHGGVRRATPTACPTPPPSSWRGIEQILRTLELERAERIKAEHPHAAPPAPAQRSGGDRAPGGVPLRSPRTRGARWVGRRGPNGRTSTSAADRSEARSTRLSVSLIRTAERWWVQRGAVAFPVDAGLPSTAELLTHGLGSGRARRRRPPPEGCRPTGCRCCRR